MFRRTFRHLVTLLITLLIGGLIGATLVRFAPGFGVDERELDPRLNPDSVAAVREQNKTGTDIVKFYYRYLGGLVRGDLGTSRSFTRPTAELLKERLPLTLRVTGIGLLIAWSFALVLALAGALLRSWQFDLFASALSGASLCIPAAVLALAFAFLRLPAAWAIACIVFPKLFRYTRNLLSKAYTLPFIITARAKGLGDGRILLWHVLPVLVPQMLALAGISITLALGASVPVEALCDLPGIGQLAWQAALSRDLVLLVNLTIFVILVTLAVNAAADLLGHSFGAVAP